MLQKSTRNERCCSRHLSKQVLPSLANAHPFSLTRDYMVLIAAKYNYECECWAYKTALSQGVPTKLEDAYLYLYYCFNKLYHTGHYRAHVQFFSVSVSASSNWVTSVSFWVCEMMRKHYMCPFQDKAFESGWSSSYTSSSPSLPYWDVGIFNTSVAETGIKAPMDPCMTWHEGMVNICTSNCWNLGAAQDPAYLN